MSEEAKVEGTEAPKVEGADDTGFGAEWASLKAKEEGQEETPPAPEGKDNQDGDKPQPETPAPAPPASEEKPDDLWKDAPPALREAYERERTRASAAETLVKRHSGRLSQAHNELNDLRAKLTPQKDGTATPEGEEATDREERHKQLLDEYGDSVGKLIPDIIRLEEKVRSLETAQVSQTEAQTEGMLQEQLVTLEQAHPTWADDVKDPAFVTWAMQEPGYVQEAIRRNANQIVDGASAADILDRFKASKVVEASPEKKRIADRRAEQMEASRDTETRAPAAAAAGSKEYEGAWKEFAEKDKRAAVGGSGRR